MFAPIIEKLASFCARLFRKKGRKPFYSMSMKEQTKKVCLAAVREDPRNLNLIGDPYMRAEVAKKLGIYDDEHMDVEDNRWLMILFTREELYEMEERVKRILEPPKRIDWEKYKLEHPYPAEGI